MSSIAMPKEVKDLVPYGNLAFLSSPLPPSLTHSPSFLLSSPCIVLWLVSIVGDSSVVVAIYISVGGKAVADQAR